MKKIILSTILSMTITAGFCQTTAVDTTGKAPAAKKELSKEEKAALKAKQEAEVNEAYKQAELSDEQIAKVKAVVTDAGKKSTELKNNTSMSDADKVVAKNKINEEKNNALKEIMGEDKFKKYNAVRKKQKEAAAAAQQ